MRKLVLIVIVAASLVAPQLADALVMCGPKRSDGSLRDGAPIRLRTACRPNELQLDPVALGLQGPQGLMGPAGEAGPQGVPGNPGMPGPGLAVRDSFGNLVGIAVSSSDVDPRQLDAVFQQDGRSFRVVVNNRGDRITGTHPVGGSKVVFESIDCTGTPLITVNDAGPRLVDYTVTRNSGVAIEVYYPAEERVQKPTKSVRDLDTGTCSPTAINDHVAEALGPLLFTSPITVELQ